MGSDTRQRHLIILIGVGIAAIAAFGWLIPTLLTVPFSGPQPGPTPPGGAGEQGYALPRELRTLSGRIVEKTASGIVVEWSVPTTKVINGPQQVFNKHVSWTKDTTFEQARFGDASATRKITSADLKGGQNVLITVTKAPQEHYELKAIKIQVLL